MWLVGAAIFVMIAVVAIYIGIRMQRSHERRMRELDRELDEVRRRAIFERSGL